MLQLSKTSFDRLRRDQRFVALLFGLLVVPCVSAEPELIVLPAEGPSWSRAISANGSTIVGELEGSAFRYNATDGVQLFLADAGVPGSTSVALVKPDQSASAVNADGSVIVGYVTDNGALMAPYRWSVQDGLERLFDTPDLPFGANLGQAFDVSADGSVIVGEYSNSGSTTEVNPGCNSVFGCREISLFTHAFRWQREASLDRFDDLAPDLSPGDSRALAVVGVGQSERLLLEQQPRPIFCNNLDCLSATFGGRYALLDSNGLDLLAGQLFVDDVPLALSANGTHVAGKAGQELLPFRWSDVTGVQLLGRRGGASLYGFSVREARDISADGRLVVGNFGVWFDGRIARLKNLLINGFGLPLLGWDFEQYHREQLFTGFGPPPVAPIGPGLHATSDSGTEWAGVALSPKGLPRAIMVRTEGMVTTQFLDGLPPFADSLALASATLPHARMARVSDTVSVFATLMNVSEVDLQGCGVALRGDLPVTMSFAATDPATNATVGELDNYFPLAAGAAQSVVLAFTATGAFASQPLPLVFDCGNKETRLHAGQASEVWLGATDDAVVDILAVSRTASADGIVRLNDELHGAFVVATQNLGGATGVVDVRPVYAIGVSQIAICETDSVTGVCLQAAQQQPLRVSYEPGQQRTFALFLGAERPLRDSFTDRRMTLNFRFIDDSPNGSVVGSTSVAVTN